MVGRWTFLLGLGLFSGAFANTLCQLSQTFLHWTYRTDTHESREKNYATDLKQKELFIVEIPDTSHKFSEELSVFVMCLVSNYWMHEKKGSSSNTKIIVGHSFLDHLKIEILRH